MRVVITDSATAVACASADIVCQQLLDKPSAVLGLATGVTPIALYQELVARFKAGSISFEQAKTFNLNEYLGVAPNHPQSHRHFMQHHLFDHIGIDPVSTHFPQGLADPRIECGRYEAAITAAGGIDLQILGIGNNGHIGSNEPDSSLVSRTRLNALTPDTIAANARLFAPGDHQPTKALAMGIATIMDAKHLLLLATGADKALAVKAMVEGPVTPMQPASALQIHREVTVVLDSAAASLLTRKKYCDWVDMAVFEEAQPRSKVVW